MLGLTAATFATTDSALTALTTSFCVDFLQMDKGDKQNSKESVSKRHAVHVAFSLLMFVTIILFNAFNDESVVKGIFKVASYTYGPLLGLYSFGLFVKNRGLHDKLVPVVCILSPALCYILNDNSAALLGGYTFSVELILINGLITFIGLLLISKKTDQQTKF
jgi:Na+/proline symporter